MVLNEITGQIPSVKIEAEKLKIPVNITLADPSFYKPKKIYLLIGADLFLFYYGHAAAPLLATRCILQFAWKYENSLPDIADIMRDDFYVIGFR